MIPSTPGEHTATTVIPNTRRRDLLIIGLGALLFYALHVDFWLYGDAALYADYSMSRTFTEVTLHLGYYWILIVAQAVVGPLLDMPIQETMVWVNVVAGAAMLCVAYLLALELLGSRRNALLTVIILALSGRVVTNATSSEVYVTQTLMHGGRVNLAKDACLQATHFQSMYPNAAAFNAALARIDPHRIMQSDMARRLGLQQQSPVTGAC